jgi:hypothetical protein
MKDGSKSISLAKITAQVDSPFMGCDRGGKICLLFTGKKSYLPREGFYHI